MTDRTRLRDLTGPEIAERAAHEVLFLPLGSIEQHGPHLPVDTDTHIAERFAAATCARTGGLLAPGFTYGSRSRPISGGGERFPGTVSLTAATHSALLADLLVNYARHGHRRIVLVNGHFENTAPAVEGVDLALERGAAATVLVVNWWEVIGADALDRIFAGDFPGWEAEHAGIVETSLMMHLDPARVRVDAISPLTVEITPPPYTVLPERPGLVDPSGVLRTAHGSSAALGEALFASTTDALAAVVRAEFGPRAGQGR
ncbi:creatininase [Embleya scabrispora]|uniref:creatininase n=1 Tax=Embleya scabrispora TaxID=159449 RepID=UPI00036CAF2E|nr:creatininase [Embleya scabrispora]MYS84912.1 creatininase [Streptomyces sp. SID5474]